MMMTRIWIALTLGLALCVPAVAQQGDASAGSSRAASPNSKLMYEDIEVMRRLMAQNLHAYATSHCQACHASPIRVNELTSAAEGVADIFLHRNSGGVAFADFDGDGFADILVAHSGVGVKPPAVEGAYLKGHGAVFTVTLPPVAHMLPAAAKPPAKPLSEWERTRLQLRGEKAPDRRPVAHPPALSDLLLKLLAENGKHFNQLSSTDSVTLVVTFRKDPPPERPGMGARIGGMPSGPSMGAAGPGMPTLPGASGPPPGMGSASGSPTGGAGSPGLPGAASGAGSFGPTDPMAGGSGSMPVTEYELLADLHRKRGNWKEVVRVYEDALRKRPRDQERELLLKLAAAQLELGQVESAKKLLEKIATAKNDAPAKPVDTPKDAPPYKLIVSAPKDILDQIGAGKITFEEFAKKASVETITK